jgi:branched-chain amino acid transport system ATP-binding protein
MLSIENLEAFYGHIRVLKNYKATIQPGEILAVIGPNGAGKTTLIRALGGLKPPQVRGKIEFNGKDLLKLSAPERARQGLAVLVEGRRVFPSLTVRENLFIGGYFIRKSGKFAENLELVLELFPVLKEKLNSRAGLLSGGEQQMLALARALVASPKLLCLDEPSFGLAPSIIDKIFKVLNYLKKEKEMGILLIEQNVALALKVADRAQVLVTGDVKMEGHSQDILHNRELLKLYLGGN